MNIFRIVPKRTDKRKYGNSPYRDVLTVLLFVFLLPYVISCLWGHIGEETAVFAREEENGTERLDMRYEVAVSGKWGKKRMSMQEYLIRKLYMVMPESEDGIFYEEEALKAQAVLLRTELWSLFLSREPSEEGPLVLQEENFWYREGEGDAAWEETRYRKAVLETDGIFLSYEGRPVKAAFFPVSNGQTRNAAEALQSDKYPYLKGVECGQDIMAQNYQSRLILTKAEYCSRMENLFAVDAADDAWWNGLEFLYDSAGYVSEVVFMDCRCSGETFRNALQLHSASFRAEWGEDTVTFYVKGVGHGFGMSQYGADRKAVEGETFDKILADYFFQAELLKIE